MTDLEASKGLPINSDNSRKEIRNLDKASQVLDSIHALSSGDLESPYPVLYRLWSGEAILPSKGRIISARAAFPPVGPDSEVVDRVKTGSFFDSADPANPVLEIGIDSAEFTKGRTYDGKSRMTVENYRVVMMPDGNLQAQKETDDGRWVDNELPDDCRNAALAIIKLTQASIQVATEFKDWDSFHDSVYQAGRIPDLAGIESVDDAGSIMYMGGLSRYVGYAREEINNQDSVSDGSSSIGTYRKIDRRVLIPDLLDYLGDKPQSKSYNPE